MVACYRTVAALVSCTGLGILLVSAKAPQPDPDLKNWLDGPAHYLANNDEIKVFNALDSDADRAAFIEKFWKRRDPVLETPRNEFRELFWQRVKEADERFADGARRGWKSDRGKIYILYGPPSRIEDDPYANTKATPTAGRGLIRWIYEGRPGGRKDLPPVVIIPFVRDLGGNYRISYDPKLSSMTFNGHDLNDPQLQAINRWLDLVSPPDRSELSVMLDLGKLQEAPAPERVLLERVDTIETYGSHPIHASVTRYEPPGGGNNRLLLVVSVAVPGADGAAKPGIIARLAPRDATRETRYVGEDSFRVEGSGPERTAQARVRVEPGTWDLTVLTAEPNVRTSGLYKSVVVVPAPENRLHLSDVVLARSLEPLSYASLVSYREPYVVGSFRVVPHVTNTLRHGDSVIVFFEIYGGAPPHTVTYRVEGKERDGSWRPLGRPAVQESVVGAQGWSLPTAPNWPIGDYRVRIVVEDAGGGSATALVPFILEPPP